MAKLYFRYGAMGCGKTMQLLQVAFNYEERGHKVCVIKPATDTKNGTKLLTRIGPERETDFCFDKKTDIFKKIKEKYKDVHCVLVDEAQFLTPAQADQLMDITIKLNIPVMAYGLRLNFRQQVAVLKVPPGFFKSLTISKKSKLSVNAATKPPATAGF